VGEHFEPIYARHHNIEQNQVGCSGLEELDRSFAALSEQQLMPE
jgi:hypothetical protein